MEISELKESIDFSDDDSQRLLELLDEIKEYNDYLKSSILEEVTDEG